MTSTLPYDLPTMVTAVAGLRKVGLDGLADELTTEIRAHLIDAAGIHPGDDLEVALDRVGAVITEALGVDEARRVFAAMAEQLEDGA